MSVPSLFFVVSFYMKHSSSCAHGHSQRSRHTESLSFSLSLSLLSLSLSRARTLSLSTAHKRLPPQTRKVTTHRCRISVTFFCHIHTPTSEPPERARA